MELPKLILSKQIASKDGLINDSNYLHICHTLIKQLVTHNNKSEPKTKQDKQKKTNKNKNN